MPLPRNTYDEFPQHVPRRTLLCYSSEVVDDYLSSFASRRTTGWVLEYPISYYKKQAIQLPRNVYIKEVIDIRHRLGNGSFSCASGSDGYIINGYNPFDDHGETGVTHYFSNSIVQQSVNRAITDARHGVGQIAEDLGQRRETYDMILSTARRLGGAMKDIRHGNFVGAARQLSAAKPGKGALHARDIGSAWLAMQYGWLPLLSDLYSVFAALDPLNNRQAFVARGRASDAVSHRLESSTQAGELGIERYDSKGTCRCELAYEVDDNGLLQASQLGLLNPISVAWELLPFSFIIDWFYPLGSYFESLGLLGATFLGGSSSLKGKTKYAFNQTYNHWVYNGAGDSYTGFQDSGFIYFTLSRDVITSTPTAVPMLANPWSSAHGYNAAALLSQYLKPFE